MRPTPKLPHRSDTGSLPTTNRGPQLPDRDRASFAQLVRETIPELMRIARVLLGTEAQAESVVQASYGAIAGSRPSFADPLQLRTQLRRLAVRECLNRRRHHLPQVSATIETLLPKFLPTGSQATPARRWHCSSAHRHHEPSSSLLRMKVDELPPRHGEVLLLRDLLALDTAETAAVLGCSALTVERTLHRAHQALRTLLEPHCVPAPAAG